MASAYQYDPALDAQARSVQRGLIYAQTAADTAQSRALQDYGVGAASAQDSYDQSGAQLDWSGQDLNTNYQRSLQDIAQGRQRTTQDYGTQTGAVRNNYSNLAASQGGQQRAAGVLAGGSLLAAARNRATNRQTAQTGLNTGFKQGMQDYDTAQSRATADFNTATARLASQKGWLTSGLSNQLGSLGLNLTRSQDDISNGLTQQGAEATQFGVDSDEQRRYLIQLATNGGA